MSKVCVKCGFRLPISKFYKHFNRNGIQYWKKKCKSCMKEERDGLS